MDANRDIDQYMYTHVYKCSIHTHTYTPFITQGACMRKTVLIIHVHVFNITHVTLLPMAERGRGRA